MTQQEIEKQLDRLVEVIRNAAAFRSLWKQKGALEQNYWKLVLSNFFDMAILNWCKVFGADGEETHWKKIVHDHTSFRTALQQRAGISKSKWETYWKEMTEFRSTQISHCKQPPNLTNYPVLDIAIETSCYYYEWLVRELKSLGYADYDNNLQDYYSRFLGQTTKVAEVICDSTKHIIVEDS